MSGKGRLFKQERGPEYRKVAPPLPEEMAQLHKWFVFGFHLTRKDTKLNRVLVELERNSGKYVFVKFLDRLLYLPIDKYAELYRFRRCPHCGGNVCDS